MILLFPYDAEGNGGPDITPTPPVETPKTPVTSPSSAPKAARELSAKEKEVTFKMDASLLDKSPGDLKEDIKKVDPVSTPLVTDEPTSPIKKEEVKPIAPKLAVPKPVVEKVEAAPIVPKTAEKKEYDYSGFSADEVTVLKNMSVQSRDVVSKLMKENKELSKSKDGQFMQHPSAYTLDPQYEKLQEDVFYYNKETEYWQEQLVKAKNGESWSGIKGWTKDGKPIAGPEQDATPAAEEQIRLMMNRCYTATEGKQQELKQFATNYKNRLTTDTKAINEERARRFGWVSNPEILKSEVEIDSGISRTVGDIREDLISMFPPYMRNTLGVEVSADLFAALQIFGQENRELKATKTVEQVKEEEASRVEPTSRQTKVEGPGKVVGGVKQFSLEGLPK